MAAKAAGVGAMLRELHAGQLILRFNQIFGTLNHLSQKDGEFVAEIENWKNILHRGAGGWAV